MPPASTPQAVGTSINASYSTPGVLSSQTPFQHPSFYGGASSSPQPPTPNVVVSDGGLFQTNVEEVIRQAELDRDTLIVGMQEDTARHLRISRQIANANLNAPNFVVGQLMPGAATLPSSSAATPIPGSSSGPAITQPFTGLGRGRMDVDAECVRRSERSRSDSKPKKQTKDTNTTPAPLPKKMPKPRPPPIEKPDVPMMVDISTPKEKSRSPSINWLTVPLPKAKARSRSKSIKEEEPDVIPILPKAKARSRSKSVKEEEPDVIPVRPKAKAKSRSRSKSKADDIEPTPAPAASSSASAAARPRGRRLDRSEDSIVVPQVVQNPKPQSRGKSESSSSSPGVPVMPIKKKQKRQSPAKAEPAETPNVVSTPSSSGPAASSRAAAAPADNPDVIPVSATPGPQPIPSRIINKRLLAELEQAAANGVLRRETLKIYTTTVNAIAYHRTLGSLPGNFEWDELRGINKDAVYNKRPQPTWFILLKNN
jgi:hypothetical protein